MDFQNMTLVGIMTIGFVNFLTMWKPDLDSRIKFTSAFVFGLLVTFIPTDIGNIILDHVKIALEVTLASSGVYKLGQKMGGV